MRTVMLSVCALALLVWTGAALAGGATEIYFTNAGGDGLWTTVDNWDPTTDAPPDDPSDDNAWIGGGLTVTITNHTATPKRLRPGCDPTFYTTNGIGDGSGDGTVIVGQDGVVDLTLGGAQYAYIGMDASGSTGTVIFQANGRLETCGFGVGRGGGIGRVEIHDQSVLNATEGGMCGVSLASGRQFSGSSGTIIQDGGTLNVRNGKDTDPGYLKIANTDWVGDLQDCTGLYEISGGTLNVYNDPGLVNGGLIAMGASSGSRDVSNNVKATFHVIGAWDPGVDNITAYAFRMYVDDRGTGNEANLIFDIDGSDGIEPIVVEADALFDGKLVVNAVGSGHTGTYTLVTYASVDGDFDEVDLPAGWTYEIGSTELTVTVPEPATLVLLGLGGLGVLLRRRRS